MSSGVQISYNSLVNKVFIVVRFFKFYKLKNIEIWQIQTQPGQLKYNVPWKRYLSRASPSQDRTELGRFQPCNFRFRLVSHLFPTCSLMSMMFVTLTLTLTLVLFSPGMGGGTRNFWYQSFFQVCKCTNLNTFIAKIFTQSVKGKLKHFCLKKFHLFTIALIRLVRTVVLEITPEKFTIYIVHEVLKRVLRAKANTKTRTKTNTRHCIWEAPVEEIDAKSVRARKLGLCAGTQRKR